MVRVPFGRVGGRRVLELKGVSLWESGPRGGYSSRHGWLETQKGYRSREVSPPEKQKGIVQGETSRCSEEIPFGQTLVFVGSKIWIEKDSLLNGQDDQVGCGKELPGPVESYRTRHRTKQGLGIQRCVRRRALYGFGLGGLAKSKAAGDFGDGSSQPRSTRNCAARLAPRDFVSFPTIPLAQEYQSRIDLL